MSLSLPRTCYKLNLYLQLNLSFTLHPSVSLTAEHDTHFVSRR